MHLTWLRSIKLYNIKFGYFICLSMEVQHVLERMLYNPVNYISCRLC